MTNLRIAIDDEFLQTLRINLGSNMKPTEMIRDALAVYNWAAAERRKGRLIVSSDESGTDLAQLKYPPLDNAVPEALRELRDKAEAAA
jgi:capsule polysaccharide export protein KpsC/LpsZ